MKKVELLCFAAIFLFLGTGLYTQMPGFAYVPVAAMMALLFIDRRFLRHTFKYLEPNMLMGILLFNGFLWLQIILSNLAIKQYFTQMFALNMMALSYTSVKLILDGNPAANSRIFKYIGILLISGLLLLLSGQIAQIAGYIEQVNFSGADENTLLTRARPGGFQNPNTTAAIALAMLFALMRLGKVAGSSFISIGLPVGVAIVMLTQSRAAILTLLVFVVMLMVKNSLRNIVTVLLIVFISAYFISITYPDEVNILMDNILQRFEGDSSSDERKMLLSFSLDAIGESPVWGNGSSYMIRALGTSSHNQIVETMVSYGFVGLLIIGAAFFLLYMPSVAWLFVCCICPMLLFSHNFFDTYSYQTSLGLTLAVSRLVDSTVHTDQSPDSQGAVKIFIAAMVLGLGLNPTILLFTSRSLIL